MNGQLAVRVSVIIPAYNSARFLPDTLHSVLAQTYSDYEVIVVDDGSTDDTEAVVMAVGGPVRYLPQSNGGPSAARNAGIGAARGEFICFLDADDLWTPDKLVAQVDFMDRSPNVGLVFADGEEFDESGVQCASLLSKSRFDGEIVTGTVIVEAFQKLLEENFIPTSTVMVRKSCFATTGLFDPALKGPEDRDMWSRIAAHFPIACLRRTMGRKRVVLSSVSRNVETTLRSRILLWRKAHRLFPALAPKRVVNALLTPTYVELGFLLLNKNETSEARVASIEALKIARKPSQWLLAASLLLFSFTGRTAANVAFGAKRWLRSAASRVLPNYPASAQ